MRDQLLPFAPVTVIQIIKVWSELNYNGELDCCGLNLVWAKQQTITGRRLLTHALWQSPNHNHNLSSEEKEQRIGNR